MNPKSSDNSYDDAEAARRRYAIVKNKIATKARTDEEER